MKIVFISDIHGKPDNLKILNDINFDKLVVLGDIFGYSEDDNNKILSILSSFSNVFYLKGNCDNESYLTLKKISYFNDYLYLKYDNCNIFASHGNKYNYDNLSVFDYDGIIIYGHKHYPYIKDYKNNTYICIGSISYPRNNSVCSYAIYENNKIIIYDLNGNILFIKNF